MKNIPIGLVQINNSFSGQSYFPYSAGLLQSYAQNYSKNKNILNFNEILFKRIPVDEAVSKLQECDLVAFSLYVWNVNLSLTIAKKLKEINKNCFIVVGGPQVPDKAKEFMESNKYIDLAVHGEGEIVFCDILDNFIEKSFDSIGSISYIKNGIFTTKEKINRLRDLEKVPSPYTSGIFDSLISNNKNESWIALWETNRGCPFSCTFCDWGSATAAKVNQFGMSRLEKEVEWFANNRVEYIFCCDANYGILPRDLDITRYVIDVKNKTGYPQGFSVQCTKNATERAFQCQKLISDSGMQRGVDIALQSVDPQTLKYIKRDNISVKTYEELQKRFVKDKIETYTDLIIALPGETYESFINGIDTVINMGQHNRIQFNNLSILPNAEIGNLDYQKTFDIKWIESNIVNPHGLLNDETVFIQEKQQLVVSTNSMPKEDWIKTRAYCWMVALLHFNKLLQIPIIILKENTSLRYKDIFDAFMNDSLLKKYPTLQKIKNKFIDKAIDIQNGGEEYTKSKEWLNIWWYEDEHAFINLIYYNKINSFYEESTQLLKDVVDIYKCEFSKNILDESIQLNKWLLNLPFSGGEENIELTYNLYEFYVSVREGNNVQLKPRKVNYNIEKKLYETWDEWLKEVVWYGNKKGTYIHKLNMEI